MKKGRQPDVFKDEILIILHKDGYDDFEIGSALGVNPDTICVRRKRLCLPPNLHKQTWKKVKKHCISCNKEIFVKTKTKYCKVCKQDNVSRFFEIRWLRSTYVKLLRNDPEKAKEIKQEMLATEGHKFTEMALNGIEENNLKG